MSYSEDFVKNMEKYEEDKEYRLYDLQMNVNESICARMEELGMDSRALAKKLQIGITSMNRYMEGEKIYDLDILTDICLVLGLKMKPVFEVLKKKEHKPDGDNIHHFTS